MDFIFKNVHGLFRTCPLLPGALTAGSAPRLLRPSPPCFVLPSHTGKSPWFPGNLLPQQSVHTFRERGALARPALRWAQLPVPRLTLQRTEFHTVLGGPQTPRIQHRARAPSPHFRPPRSAPASVTLHPDGWAVCAGAPQPRPLGRSAAVTAPRRLGARFKSNFGATAGKMGPPCPGEPGRPGCGAKGRGGPERSEVSSAVPLASLSARRGRRPGDGGARGALARQDAGPRAPPLFARAGGKLSPGSSTEPGVLCT